MAKDRNRGRTKAVNAPYVPSRVVRDWALMSCLLPSARIEGGGQQGTGEGHDRRH